MSKLYKVLLAALTLSVAGAQAETVSPYSVDFNTPIATSAHDFRVASNWRHIVGAYTDSYNEKYYMSYSYSSTGGVDGSGALSVPVQQAGESYYDMNPVNDYLVTPAVAGTVTLKVKKKNYQSKVDFYAVDETGTTIGDVIKNVKAADLVDGEYVLVSFELDDLQRVAIRANNVYIDDFTATEANIEKEKSIQFESIEPNATTGQLKWNQLPNGLVEVKYTVTVTNNGEADLKVGDKNYSVSIINGSTNEVLGKTNVPQDLAIGETSAPFEVKAEVATTNWPNSWSQIRMNLRENLQGSVSERAYSVYKAYEPVFVFREAGKTSKYSDPIAFGLLKEAAEKNFEIYNDGAAPLVVKSISVPEGFVVKAAEGEFTVQPGESQSVVISLPADVKGSFSGNFQVVYLDKEAAEQTFSLPISGSILGANTWAADFNAASSSDFVYPEGSIAETGVDKDYSYSNGGYNFYLKSQTSSSYVSENNKFITPKLHAEAGESLTFDVTNDAYSPSADHALTVYVSTDRKNWTEKMKISAKDIATSRQYENKVLTFDEAGDYYVAFGIYQMRLDNIVGLQKVDVAHDLFITEFNQPDEVQSGEKYNARLSVLPVLGANAADYSIIYYVDGKEKATIAGQDLKATASVNSDKDFAAGDVTVEVESTASLPCHFEIVFTDGTKYVSDVKTLKVTNEPAFVFFDKGSYGAGTYKPDNRKTDIAFGKVSESNLKQEFEIFNWGTAPLQVKSVSVPEGFTASVTEAVTVPAKTRQALDITFAATQPGFYSGNLAITYVDGEGNDAVFELPVNGTLLDASKWYANFEGGSNGTWPAGSLYESNISMTNLGTYSVPNYAINSTSSTKNMFITPLLTAAAGEALQFDAKTYSSSWSEGTVKVYAAATREALADEAARTLLVTVSGQSEDEATKANADGFRTFSAVVPEAGSYYLGLEISGRLYIDELYGLSLAPVAHDWILSGADIPAEAMQNVAKNATVSLLNIGLTPEAAGSYQVVAYVNGKASVNEGSVVIPVVNKLSETPTEIDVPFRSPKAGTFPVYVEVKAGDYSVKSEPIDVTFVDEVLSSEVVVGTANGTGSTPVNLNYRHNEGVMTFPADELGLSNGAKINAIRLKGKGSTEHTTSLQVYYEWTDEAVQPAPSGTVYDASAMTKVIDEASYTWPSSSDNIDLLTINFPEPLVYEAGKSLRLFVKTDASGYKVFNFEQSKTKNCYNQRNDNSLKGDWSQTYLPMAYIDLAVEARTLSGTVTDYQGNAVAGAVVNLTSEDGDDVQYEAVTAADGAYSVNVIQSGRFYALDVKAEGLQEFDSGIDVADASVVKDIVLRKVVRVADDAEFNGGANDAIVYFEPGFAQGMNAVALPFDVDGTVIDELFGSTAKVYVFDDVDLKGAENIACFLAYTPGSTIPAGTPFLVNLDMATEPVRIDHIDVCDALGAKAGYNADFVAASALTDVTDDMLTLSADGQGFGTPVARETEKVLPFRAYIKMKRGENVKYARIAEQASAVDTITGEDITGEEVIYDLRGIRVVNPVGGIYIINGKKVLVK